MTIGSLFSGVGGLELGLERAGLGPVLWQCEIDPFCRAVLAKNWPHVTRYTDVRALVGSTLPPVQVLCGGFPCQDVSAAGKRAGLDGERSGLWFEFARLIAETKPRAVVAENVLGLVGRALDTVAGRLSELGYSVDVTRLQASDIGAPHRRERVFIVAYTRGERGQGERLQPRGQSGQGGAGAPRPATGGEVGGMAHASGLGLSQPRRERDGAGLPAPVGGGAGTMAYAHGERQPQPQGAVSGQWGWAVHRSGGVDLVDPMREGCEGHGRAGGGEAELAQQRLSGGWAPQSSVGECFDGLFSGLAGPGPGGAWPAGRGAPQHSWEPPRTLAGVKNRPAMLRALGNAVCPQQAYVVGLRVRQLLEAP